MTAAPFARAGSAGRSMIDVADDAHVAVRVARREREVDDAPVRRGAGRVGEPQPPDDLLVAEPDRRARDGLEARDPRGRRPRERDQHERSYEDESFRAGARARAS